MSVLGTVFLWVALLAAAASVAAFAVAGIKGKDAGVAAQAARAARIGRMLVGVSAAALLVCCLILAGCFLIGDVSLLYVLQERSNSTSSLAWFYKLSGLWAGRAGSLLFWAFLISLFSAVISLRTRRDGARLDSLALLVMQLVLVAFLCAETFSASNNVFVPTPASYFDADGTLSAMASVYGMNRLLEHWAMAIHPPTLFIGYAGMTVPFAYAAAALIANDDSKAWVNRARGYTVFGWLFLGIGIGLGSVWAYVVLGWGGYWGWDAVENASLLSWLVGVALIHSFTVYRQRGAFKRWAVMCACLAFAFVIVGTFISRSGIVQSVHAFEGDPVSLVLFGLLIVSAVLVGVVGLIVRRTSFNSDIEGDDDVERIVSRNGAYYFNNVVMLVFTLVLTYMTISSALPSWLPFGGKTLSTTSYNALARPLGVFYLFILAFCPLLAWGKTDFGKLARQGRVPGVCALALFIALMVYFATTLVPAYDATLARGGTAASDLLENGPRGYYLGLTVVGFAVASLLFFNALFFLVRTIKGAKGIGLRACASTIGGSIAHVAMAVILVGLIGSSMYVTERTGYLTVDGVESGKAQMAVGNYTLTYESDDVSVNEQEGTALYSVTFDVRDASGSDLGEVTPSVQLDMMTQQQKLNAAVISTPAEDLFVVYRGVNASGALSMDVRVNRLISLVWVGFVLLMVGTAVALLAKRNPRAAAGGPAPAAVPAGE